MKIFIGGNLINKLISALIKTKKNSVTRVRERSKPTELPPLVEEVRANFLRIEDVA
jgi:hypothetical protein